MQILPVLDLLDGTVVRGVAGRRATYRPVESQLVSSAEPVAVANAVRDQLGLNRIYVADLDGIERREPHLDVVGQLASEGFELIVDAGLRDIGDAERLFDAGVTTVIVALETSPRRELIAELCSDFGSPRVIFSLDLKQGHPLGRLDECEDPQPFQIAEEVVGLGIEQMIVLDLAWVGTGEGIATEGLCRDLLKRFSQLRVITGGGVRGPGDLVSMKTLGVHGLLVASALHDGRIGRSEIEAL